MKSIFKKGIFILIGSFIAAIGLEIFLVPNNIIDGGITGISIMASYLSGLPLGVFLVLLNLPFVILGYKQIGKTFAVSTLVGVTALSCWLLVIENWHVAMDDPLLATVFGGLILGVGVGFVLRSGGSLDGTEIIAILAGKKLPFSIGEIVMFFNIFIFAVSALLFGWDRALYSILAYYIAFKAIDVTVEGLNESKSVFIITNKATEITAAITDRLGRGVTVMQGVGGYSGEEKSVLFSVITRLEMSKMKAIVEGLDSDAFVTFNDVHEVLGGNFKKKAIH